MNKNVLAVTCLLSAVSACATSPFEQLSSKNQDELSAKEFAAVLKSDIETTAAESEVICFTIKIYKDREKHDEKVWKELVEQAIDTTKAIDNDVIEWVEGMTELFCNAYEKRGNKFGIHGHVYVNFETNKNDKVQVQETEVTRSEQVAEEETTESPGIACACETEDADDATAEEVGEPEAEVTRSG